jgi:type I restriction enzyme R subunit
VKFKDPNDPFRIVFVCAMWITGFDVPSCSTIYLDKPMRNHTLMQTIARANRVFKDKINGLIVDYVGVFRNLQKALAIYGSGSGGGVGPGETPVRDKQELVAELQECIHQASLFCKEREVDLDQIRSAEPFVKIKLIGDAVECIIVNDESKKKYLSMAFTVYQLFKAILPDPIANQVSPHVSLIGVIAEKIRALAPPVDISGVLSAVEGVLDRSISAQGYTIHEPVAGKGLLDLSHIDFESLKKQFVKGRKRTEAEQLKSAIQMKLLRLIRLNRSRIDYMEKFQQMIDEYNAGSMNLEQFYGRLVEFAQRLNEEERRHIAEALSEEELAMFDLLTKPEPKLTKKQDVEVKKVAQELLETLKKERLVLDWRKKQQSRAAVRLSIEQMLDKLPALYTPALYQQKCDIVYQHVYDSYYGQGNGVYG